MGYLPDTNIPLPALIEPSQLSKRVSAAFDGGPNVDSVVTSGQVVLKPMKGKLAVPPIHHDPFDRVLLAQAGNRKARAGYLRLQPAEVCGRHDSSHSLRQ
jgi:hypothetical protein